MAASRMPRRSIDLPRSELPWDESPTTQASAPMPMHTRRNLMAAPRFGTRSVPSRAGKRRTGAEVGLPPPQARSFRHNPWGVEMLSGLEDDWG